MVDQEAETKLDFAVCFLVASHPVGFVVGQENTIEIHKSKPISLPFAEAISKNLRSSGCQENA